MEIKFFKHCIICLIAVSSLTACLRDEPVVIDGGDETDDVKTYTLGTPTSFSTKLEGLSAICLNEAEDGLLVAEDNGHVYEFGFDGSLKNTFSFPSPNDAHDWEGITRAADGTIYLCEERLREVYKLNADHKGVTLVSKGPIEDGSEENQGYEGIAAANDILYIANQSKPFRIYSYSLKSGKWNSVFDVSGAQSLSDLFYDSEDGTLWITDAKTQQLTQINAKGTVLNDYDISFVKKPEGFCKVPGRSEFWFVCDKTSALYKVTYK